MLPLRKSCQSCNMAKLKCNGQRPQCTRCSRRGTHCLYAPSKPVGRPPRRPHLRTNTQPLSASTPRELRPTYHRGASAPPREDRQQPESPEAQEDGNQYSSSSQLSPPPPAQLDRPAHYQTSPEMAATFHPLDDGSKPNQDPTELYTDYMYFDLLNNVKRDKIMDLDISLLDLVSADEFPPTSSPFVDEAFSSCTTLNWSLGNEPLDLDLSPTFAEITGQSPATATLPPDNAWELPRFYGNGFTKSNTKSPLACCTCLTAVINLLFYRSNMRKASSAETMQYNDGELERLMQKGLSGQQRCKLCLEDPLISMIWARITDEYITAVIALRQGK
ncbi:hypothetical protein V8F06_004777 [Rhypophila decipiens]